MSQAGDRLRGRIRDSGPIPFGEFMQEALYGPGGYYARAELPIGEQGDYVTGSSYSPLFGRATARVVARLDGVLGHPADFLEAGYGNGGHLAAVARALAAGPSRRMLGWDRIARRLPAAVTGVPSLEELAPREIEGLIFSYELFDALPVHRLVERPSGGLGELWVGLREDGAFCWQEGELSRPGFEELIRSSGVALVPGQVADLSPWWEPLYRELARRLGRGLLVTCDYGFEIERLLDVRVRPHGTLACYRKQTVHRNPFTAVGGQDLTAHIDFTALRCAGEQEGLTTVALTRQAAWLTAAGLFEDLAEVDLETRRQAMALLDPEGMGEEIRVLVQAREVPAEKLFDLALLRV